MRCSATAARYLYEQDDVVFYVGTHEHDLAVEFLAALP